MQLEMNRMSRLEAGAGFADWCAQREKQMVSIRLISFLVGVPPDGEADVHLNHLTSTHC